jgi:uroporphyrinogen decarboxylase
LSQNFPLKNPKPDFESFIQILDGIKKPEKVHFAEIVIDEEIKKFIVVNCFNERNYSPVYESNKESLAIEDMEKKKQISENYYKQLINFYLRMGYCFLMDDEFPANFESLNTVSLKTSDPSIFSRGQRQWSQEGFGMIGSWDDFEKFPWDKTVEMIDWTEYHLKFMKKNLPDGMKLVISGSIFSSVLNFILGFEGTFFIIHDKPELFEAVINKVAEINFKVFEMAVQMECVGALLIGDDLGFKTSTMISPSYLRKWIFPWYKKYAELAHHHGKHFWSHCCGYKTDIMEDFIEDIKIDALHSFEDACCSVIQYKKEYGNRIALLGGADIDKLTNMDEERLRVYIRNILNICMENGRFALGSGNSITNYIPVKNYLIMLQEGLNWRL